MKEQCTCHISPPCNYCTRPDNPENVASLEDELKWYKKEQEFDKKMISTLIAEIQKLHKVNDALRQTIQNLQV